MPLSGDLKGRLAPQIVVGLKGPELSEGEASLLERFPPAGVIIFARNVESPGALEELVSKVRSLTNDGEGRPPLVMADHEGGRTSVLAAAAGIPPSQMAVGRAASLEGPEVIREVFEETAGRMLSMGVNMALSPVADVNSEYLNPIIGTRSFSESSEEVRLAVAEAVRAMKGTGILTCLKHFPGHGSTAGDSHVELPVTGKNTSQLQAGDLPAFEAGIAAGADSVMTAHVAPIDRMIPSSLDGVVIGGLLRDRLSYDGLVVTDGLEMAGILTGSGLSGAAASAVKSPSGADPVLFEGRGDLRLLRPACVVRTALEAGNDLLLFTRPVEEVYSELDEVLPVLEEDFGFWQEEFPALSSRSVQRIAKVREAANGRVAHRPSDKPYIAAARSSLRVEGGGAESLPLSLKGPPAVLFCGERPDFDYYPVRSFVERFLAELGAALEFDPSGLFHLRTVSSPASAEKMEMLGYWTAGRTAAERKSASSADGSDGVSPAADVVVLVNRRPVGPKDIAALTGRCRVVVAAERPWAAKSVPAGTPTVVTYGISDVSAVAAAAAISGKEGPGNGEFD